MITETREQVDAAEVYSRIGRLEGEASQMNSRLDRIEAAQNRMLYWILGIGAAVLVSVWVGNLTG